MFLVVSDSLGPPWTVAHQDPLSMESSRKEYWSGLPFPTPRDLPNPGIEPTSLALAGGFFTTSATWEAHQKCYLSIIHTWPWKWLVWLCGLHSEAMVPKLLKKSDLCRMHFSFRMNRKNSGGKSVRRREVHEVFIRWNQHECRFWHHLFDGRSRVLLETLPWSL